VSPRRGLTPLHEKVFTSQLARGEVESTKDTVAPKPGEGLQSAPSCWVRGSGVRALLRTVLAYSGLSLALVPFQGRCRPPSVWQRRFTRAMSAGATRSDARAGRSNLLSQTFWVRAWAM
jgi:hypothetical protein